MSKYLERKNRKKNKRKKFKKKTIQKNLLAFSLTWKGKIVILYQTEVG